MPAVAPVLPGAEFPTSPVDSRMVERHDWRWLLKLTVSITLLARGWLYFRWDSPIRGLLWQEEWWSGILENCFDTSWGVYAAHSDPYITRGIEWVGILLMCASALPWFCGAKQKPWWVFWPLLLASLVLVIDAVARWHEKSFQIGMLIEMSLQCTAPFLLICLWPLRNRAKHWNGIAAVACSLTFIGHAFYALNIHPRPSYFSTMSMDILRMSEQDSITLLTGVGILDITVAICIFLPGVRTAAIWYMVVWGALTALARVVANVNPAENYYGLDPWLAEAFVRAAHCSIPLLLLVTVEPKKK